MMQVKTSNQEQDKKQSFLHIHYFVQKLADCSVSFFLYDDNSICNSV